MALNESNGIPATMLVGPANNAGMPFFYGGGNNGGYDNGNGWWIILLFIILLAAGNWGNNGGGFLGNNDGNVQRGFDQAAVMSGVNGINAGLGDIQTALCSGFAGVNATVNNGFGNLSQQLFSNQIADMQNAFAMQSQFANCCCENRLATAQTQNIIQNEANATRLSDANNTRAILDKLCQLELDGKNDRINDLERQLTMANLAASQTAQTARILADNAAQTVALEQYLNPTPIPAYTVQNPNCCQQNFGCGCGV